MIRFLFVAICGAVGLGAAIRSRFGALLFYIWYALFRPQDFLWFSIAEYRLSLAIGLMLVASSAVAGVLPIALHPLWLGSVVFWLFALLAQQYAVAPDIGWTWLTMLGNMLIVSALLIRLTNTVDRYYSLIAVLAGSFAFFSAKAGFFALLSGGTRYWDGLGTGAFTDNNAYAVGCVMVIPLICALAQTAKVKWVKLAWWSAAMLTVITVVSTFSRGGFLALAAAMLAFIGLQAKAPRKLVVVAVLCLIALVVVPVPEGYFDRMGSITTYEEVQENSALSRLHVWKVGVDIAKDHPWGVGLWNFQSMYNEYDFSDGAYGLNRAAHNSHLQAVVETGYLGGLVWGGLQLMGLWMAWRVRRRGQRMTEGGAFFQAMGTAMFASQIGFIVGDTFVAMAYNDLTWLGFGCVAVLDRLAAAEPATVPERVGTLQPRTPGRVTPSAV